MTTIKNNAKSQGFSVGTLGELWCYPVKSMAGISLNSANISKAGLDGDRCWIVRDEQRNENALVRTLPKLLHYSATYLDSKPADQGVGQVAIRLPDGSSIRSDQKDVNQRLSNALGREVSLWPLQPVTNWQHYRLRTINGSREMKRMFAAKELPDFSSISWKLLSELVLFTTPLGRYYDAYPLHLITTAGLEKLRQLEPEGDFGPHRFRPNIVIQSHQGVIDFEDFGWVDGILEIGSSVRLRCESRTVRCSMPAAAQAGYSKDSKVLRAIDRATDRHFGVNLSVMQAGRINVGDAVTWYPANPNPVQRQFYQLSGQLKNRVSHGVLKAVDYLQRKKT